jgi:hypothetical protein
VALFYLQGQSESGKRHTSSASLLVLFLAIFAAGLLVESSAAVSALQYKGCQLMSEADEYYSMTCLRLGIASQQDGQYVVLMV